MQITETIVRGIPLEQITADPGQPRKTFNPAELSELAASIRANGLLQPITVRPVGPDAFWIVAGERRFRAHQINGAETIRALVIEGTDHADVRVKQIIENDQRADVPPLEQGRSYQVLMTETGWTAEELAQRIGKSVFRITERTDLLKLAPEYQSLLAGGNLKPLEAAYMSRLGARGQATLFAAIKGGRCKTANDLRVAAFALIDAESQTSLLGDEPDPVTEEEVKVARGFEAQAARISALLRSGIQDNQVTAVRKVNPHRAAVLADLFAAMQSDLRRIEIALRQAAIQTDFLAA